MGLFRGLVQDGPKMAQDGPRWPQDGPKMAQDGPKMAQDGPRWPQDGPKTHVITRKRALDSLPRTSSRGWGGSAPFKDSYSIRILYVMGLIRSGVFAPKGLIRHPKRCPR